MDQLGEALDQVGAAPGGEHVGDCTWFCFVLYFYPSALNDGGK